MEKLRDKATVFTFHGDAVLQGLALAQIGGNFFPTGDYNMRLRTYQDEEGGLVRWYAGGEGRDRVREGLSISVLFKTSTQPVGGLGEIEGP